MKNLVIVGIDPGSTTLGLGVLTCDPNTLKITRTDMFTISAFDVYQTTLLTSHERQADLSALDRIRLISKALLYRLEDYEITLISVEEPFFNRFRPGAFKPLVIQVEQIKSDCAQVYPTIPIVGFAPMQIKRGVGATSMKGKRGVHQAVMSNEELMTTLVQSVETLTEHSIDAIACAYTVLSKLKSIYGVPAAETPDKGEGHHLSFYGKLRAMYFAQRKRCVERGHSFPTYTSEQLTEWCLGNGYSGLYVDWMKSGYARDKAPSVDRLDNTKGYSFDNIRLVTWRDNLNQHVIDISVEVSQYTLDGEYIKTYKSRAEAARKNGLSDKTISKCTSGVCSSCGGYQWRNTATKNIGKCNNKRLVPIRGTSIKTGNVINFASVSAAVKKTGVSRKKIDRCLIGITQPTDEYRWEKI